MALNILWVMVDNRINNVLDVEIYLGKNGDDTKPKRKLIGESVVLKLNEPYFDRQEWCYCTFDNFLPVSALSKLYMRTI